MRDMSMHVMDLVENAVRAGASTVEVSVAVDKAADRFEIAVEDDGPGLPVPAEAASDPFFTTKEGKRTGLGLSLFRSAAERAGGAAAMGRSPLGGAAVRASMSLAHVDRSPLGDLAGTMWSIALANPGLELRCRVRAAGGERDVRTRRGCAAGREAARAAREFGESVAAALRAAGADA